MARGDFECPKCGVPLRIGDPQHFCNLWTLYGRGLDRMERERFHWRLVMGYGPKELYGP